MLGVQTVKTQCKNHLKSHTFLYISCFEFMIPTVDIRFAIAEPRYAQKNAIGKQDSVIRPELCNDIGNCYYIIRKERK